MEGWIKLHRELVEKAIWTQSTPEQASILITLLTMANHEEKEWIWKGKKFKAKPGQIVTSLDSIKKRCPRGISIGQIRTCLVKFENLEFLANESTKTGRLISIVNWEIYQAKDEKPTKESADDRQSIDKEPTPNKNDKNYKNDKKKYISSKFDSFWEEYPRKVGKQSAKSVYQREVTSEEQEQKILDSLSLQKRIWQEKGTAIEYIPHPEKWLKHKRYEDDFSAEAKAVIKKSDNAHEPDINFKSDEECPPWST